MAIIFNALSLPDGLKWEDEFSSAKVVQTVKRTLAGSPVVFYGQRLAGIPITLSSSADEGWATRNVVQSLASMADVPGAVYTLSLRGVSYSVVFRHDMPPAFKADPVINVSDPQSGDYYMVKINLMTV